MNFGEGVLDAVFMMLVVFAALALVYLLIRASSAALRKNKGEQREPQAGQPKEAVQSEAQSINSKPDGAAYGGTIKLQNVDDQTAAMIMAIISDTTGIPLDELCFKSIRLITE